MYSIAEAAERTGVSAHTLRYYERIGLLERVARAPSGHRAFGKDDLGRIEFLTLLRRTGMTIRDMGRFMELTRAGNDTIADRVELLERHRRRVRTDIDELERHASVIDRKLAIYRASAARD